MRIALPEADVAGMFGDQKTLDRQIVLAIQGGLPLHPQPYHLIADRLGIRVEFLQDRLRSMLRDGRIRRIGAIPNHYRLGYQANGMSVWDVEDDCVAELGPKVGALNFVSHAYRRPRRLPVWPYNLFAMVHGHDRDDVYSKVQVIEQLLGDTQRQYDVLFSLRILKKTGMRWRPEPYGVK